MRPLARPLAIALALCCLSGLVVGPAAALVGPTGQLSASSQPTAVPSPDRSTPERTLGGSALRAQESTPTNNSSVQHEDPDEVDGSADTGALRRYLTGKLAERLTESSVEISRGQYERGDALLGEEYQGLLEKYVDVAGETDTANASAFERASRQQARYANLTARYNETYGAYQRAKQAGNETRARALARELDRLADRIEATGGNLTRSYQRLETTTDANLTQANQAVVNATNDVEQRQSEVVQATFVGTNLSVETPATTASFTDPALVRGRLVAENGTAVANRTVRLRVGRSTHTVRTNASGEFSLTYRPTRIASNATAVPVRYRPADASVFLGSNASLPLAVENATGRITVTAPDGVGFGETIPVRGTVTVDGTPVPDMRLRLRLGDAVLGTARTDRNGTYTLDSVLPAAVGAGEQRLSATLVPADAAVGAPQANTTVTVQATGTNLTLDATTPDPGQIRVTGRLTTATGTALAGRTVELRVAGSTVETVETGPDGRFAVTLRPDGGLSGAVSVTAAFDDPGSSLAGSTASVTVRLRPPEPGAGGWTAWSTELLAGGGLVLLGVAGVRYLYGTDEEGSVTDPPTDTGERVEATSATRGFHDRARERLADGNPEDAVAALYAGVRASLGDEVGGGNAGTHWEFYAAVSSRLDGERAAALERLTEAYERAVYGNRPVDAARVRVLLDAWADDGGGTAPSETDDGVSAD